MLFLPPLRPERRSSNHTRPSQLHPQKIRPVARLSLVANTISQPYFLPDSTCISVLTRHALKGIIIPHSNSDPPPIEQIELLSRPDLVATVLDMIMP